MSDDWGNEPLQPVAQSAAGRKSSNDDWGNEPLVPLPAGSSTPRFTDGIPSTHQRNFDAYASPPPARTFLQAEWQGAKEGFGSEPLGIGGSWFDPQRGANPVMAAAGRTADAFMRVPGAVMGGVVGAVDEAGNRLGVPGIGDTLNRQVIPPLTIEAGVKAGSGGLPMLPRTTLNAAEARGVVSDRIAQFPHAPLTPGEVGGAIKDRLAQGRTDATARKAANAVERRINQDIKAGGATAQEVVDKLNRARSLGKPVALLDSSITGSNAEGLAGSVSRRPGPSQGVIKNALQGRDASAPQRLTSDISQNLTGGGSAFRTQKALLEARQSESQPLYDKAFAGGSLAPLQEQFETAFSQSSAAEKQATNALQAARNDLTLVQSKHLPTTNVYASAAGQRAEQAAQQKVLQAQQDLARAASTKQQVLDKLRLAQDDIKNGTPGAVWNPRIQQFLDDPVMKRGMARGLEIQRLESLAAGKPFDPSELALSPEGEVIRVPNMRTLDAGKKGLDAIIESEGRDEFGRLNQYGRAVNQVRVSLLDELDRINPDYKQARAAWSGYSSSLDAVKFGRNFNRLNSEQLTEEFSQMTDSDKEFARIGVADNILERIGKTGFGGDESKSIIRNEWTKGQLKPFFRDEKSFEKFIESVAIERGMFESGGRITANSATAARLAEDAHQHVETGIKAAHGISNLMSGNFLSAIRQGYGVMRDLGIRNDPDLNEQIARILTDLHIQPGVEGGQIRIRPQGTPPGASVPRVNSGGPPP